MRSNGFTAFFIIALSLFLTGFPVHGGKVIKNEYSGYLTMTVSHISDQSGKKLMLLQFKLVNTSGQQKIISRQRLIATPGHICAVKLQDQKKKVEADATTWTSRFFGDIKIDAPGTVLMVNGQFTGDATATVKILLLTNENDSCCIMEDELTGVEIGKEIRWDFSKTQPVEQQSRK